MRQILWIILLIGMICSCDSSRIDEQNKDIEEQGWHVDSIAKFDFLIENSEDPYKISMNLRNTSQYPFQRIFIGYWLKDSLGQTLMTNTENLKKLDPFYLFDPKTGTPLGKGLGDIFEHRFVLKDSLYFKAPGLYHLEFQQYMRDEELEGIVSVGFRIDDLSE